MRREIEIVIISISCILSAIFGTELYITARSNLNHII